MVATVAVAVIGIIAAFLVYHDDYDDGIIGRTTLGAMVVMSIIVVLGTVLGHYHYELPMEITVFLVGVAVFMCRHTWRFLAYKKNGDYAWNGQNRRRVNGKV